MEKLERKHHDHSFTECLKNIIFGLVMLAPFLAIAVRCGYVMWNKNAKDSYSGNNGENEVLSLTDGHLKVNTKYYFTTANINTDITTSLDYVDVSQNTTILNGNNNLGYENELYRFRLYRTNTNYFQYYTIDENDVITTRYQDFSSSYNVSFYFFSSNDKVITDANLIKCIYLVNPPFSTLDNAFSYSLSQISNDPVFNWTRNTGIYQPINAMVEGLEIENDTLQILLAYWSLMTAVYIVFDLIIFCFTKITHFING